MEQSLKKYCLLSVLFILCGCRFLGPYHYETYAPIKESLSFVNDTICVHTRYDMYKRDSIVVCDTFFWKHSTEERIILYRNVTKDPMEVSACMEDTLLNFVYDICPKWDDIKRWEFKKYADYKSPLHQDGVHSLPVWILPEERARLIRYWNPTFADKYGNRRTICDTIANCGPFMYWYNGRYKRGDTLPLALFANSKQFKEPFQIKRMGGFMLEMVTNSYEYINYKVNYDRMLGLSLAIDSITGKQFSFIGDSCKKESLRFINDSVCEHVLSMRQDKSSQYTPFMIDTCHYTIKNNLIAIDLIPNKSFDTLSYGNGMLFYSKVYKDNDQYKHIVKPFIDEARSCANKTDSINMIMSTYFDVYVPLNFYK